MSMDAQALLAGDRLGRYLIAERLGAGVSATVYRATDVEQSLPVALKVLHVAVHHQGDAIARLRRETELLSRLRHAGLCRVYELGCERSLCFLAMEFIPGRTLESVLSASGHLPARRATTIFRDVCYALAVAHDQSIIHRDLKPNNIMLRVDDTPVVLDFGLATGPGVTPITGVGAWLGTFRYVAPEVLRGTKPTKASDVFSLGASLYRTLTGSLPFPGDHVGLVAEALLRQGPTPPNAVVDDIPELLSALVLRTLKLDAHERPIDALALAIEIQQIVDRHWPPQTCTTEDTQTRAYWIADPAAEPTSILRRAPAPLSRPIMQETSACVAPTVMNASDLTPMPPAVPTSDAPAIQPQKGAPPADSVPRNYVPPAKGGFAAPQHRGASTRANKKCDAGKSAPLGSATPRK